MAALTVLTDAAAAGPVLCLIDDAQWLNQVSIEVLGFVARRLYADRVGMVFAAREGEGRAVVLAGLPELTVGGLAEEAAHELLATSAGAQVDRQVSWRIAADTAGNPLALVELAAELTAAELSGAEPLDWPLRFGGRLEELYQSRVRALPDSTQTLLLLAAADPTGEPALIWNAARNMGIDPEAGKAAGVERLVSWEPRVRFRHPLIRSAAYYAALASARRGVHQRRRHQRTSQPLQASNRPPTPGPRSPGPAPTAGSGTGPGQAATPDRRPQPLPQGRGGDLPAACPRRRPPRPRRRAAISSWPPRVRPRGRRPHSRRARNQARPRPAAQPAAAGEPGQLSARSYSCTRRPAARRVRSWRLHSARPA
jgi:hypothetical protein